MMKNFHILGMFFFIDLPGRVLLVTNHPCRIHNYFPTANIPKRRIRNFAGCGII
jgi:hypothetical protein